MFNWFKKDKITADDVYGLTLDVEDRVIKLQDRIELLETHLGVEYFNGSKNKPHYRVKRVRKEK